MNTPLPSQRRSARAPRLALSAVAVSLVSALTLTSLGTVAHANPGDGTPGGSVGDGDIWITSTTEVAKGQKISFAGEGFVLNDGAAQKLNAKWDAHSSEQAYTGVGHSAPQGTAGQFQVQGDGTVSGSLVVPSDLDDPSVNGTAAGPHFVRFLAGTPALSRWTDDFTLDAAQTAAPEVTATAVSATSRGTSTVTITVTGSGFTAGEDVSVTRAQSQTPFQWTQGSGATATKVDTIKADAEGKISGKVVLAPGILLAGEHQLLFGRSVTPDVPGVAQVTVKPIVGLANVALESKGTLTLTNAAANSQWTSLKLDPTPETPGDEVEVLDAPVTASATGAATGTFTIPGNALLGERTFIATQVKPYAATETVKAKVSPSSALLNESGYDRVETVPGAIEQGLYQSAYSTKAKALFASAASVMTTSTIYKIDPTTMKVIKSVVPATEDGTTNKWAAYGIGVDDTNGTVWVTNTRQNTVAVYDQDLNLLVQHPRNVVTHSRDVIADPANGHVFVSSASEGSTGDGAIAVFEADDKDGDGTKYEFIKNVAAHPRTQFSPMSLDLDATNNKLFSVSLTTQKAIVVDTKTLTENIIDLPDLMVGGRGASGAAYDPITKRLFVASQNSDELLIAQLNDTLTAATTLKEVPTGAGALNVTFDDVNRVAIVSNFGGTTLTVVDPNGTKVANLPLNRTNHVSTDPTGAFYAVNKDTGNKVVKFSPKKVVPAVVAGKPTIQGKAVVGQKLTLSAGTWTSGATLSRQWLRNGAAIKGATGTTYVLKAADQGKKISVKVTGTKAGSTPATATTPATAAVKAATLKSATPKVSGKAKVGKTLKVKVGAWTKGTTFRYTWLANGKAVKGATKAKLKLTKKLKGKKITVKVTGKLAGHTTVTKKSKATAKVAK